jgi:hypothetical protein
MGGVNDNTFLKSEDAFSRTILRILEKWWLILQTKRDVLDDAEAEASSPVKQPLFFKIKRSVSASDGSEDDTPQDMPDSAEHAHSEPLQQQLSVAEVILVVTGLWSLKPVLPRY